LEISKIAIIENDYKEKFGTPRQSGLVPEVRSSIIFEPSYRDSRALLGIEGFSRLWLIWGFSKSSGGEFSPTVRPPRLGGNARRGVFATRSPFRPNALGLSCVELLGVETSSQLGDVLIVSGADLISGSPIYDIKPYIPYADAFPDSRCGFLEALPERLLEVFVPPELLQRLPQEKRTALLGVLRHDPRPAYQDDPERIYGMAFGGFDVKFSVDCGVLRVLDILTLP